MSTTVSPAGTAARNMLVSGTGLLLAFGALGLFFLVATPLDGTAVLGGAFLALLALVSVATAGSALSGFRARGRRLLDCGTHPMRPLGWVMAAAGLLLAGMFLWAPEGPGVLQVVGMAYFTLFGVCFALGRLQVGEHGVWAYWGFVPWRRIDAWESGKGTLVLHTRQRPGIRGLFQLPSNQAHFTVPAHHRDALVEHLERQGIPRAS